MKNLKNINCIVYSRFIGQQYGVQFYYEETHLTEKQAMETIHRIFNDGRKFYTFEDSSFSFENGFDDSNTIRTSKKVRSINIDKISDIEFRTILIKENETN